MARNYEGEHKQIAYIREFLTESMNNSDYPEMIKESFQNNPLKYFAYRFKSEYGLYPNQNLQVIIADYLSKLAFPEIAFENFRMLELRDKWGYETNDDKWCENFFSCIASKIIIMCNRENINLR